MGEAQELELGRALRALPDAAARTLEADPAINDTAW